MTAERVVRFDRVVGQAADGWSVGGVVDGVKIFLMSFDNEQKPHGI